MLGVNLWVPSVGRILLSRDQGLSVISIARLDSLVALLAREPRYRTELERIQEYRSQYGAEPSQD